MIIINKVLRKEKASMLFLCLFCKPQGCAHISFVFKCTGCMSWLSYFAPSVCMDIISDIRKTDKISVMCHTPYMTRFIYKCTK